MYNFGENRSFHSPKLAFQRELVSNARPSLKTHQRTKAQNLRTLELVLLGASVIVKSVASNIITTTKQLRVMSTKQSYQIGTVLLSS